MRAELKRLHSPDVDLSSFRPQDDANFGFLLQAMIGPEGDASEESYDIEVCTPDWLKKKFSDFGPIFGRHFLIVFTYDQAIIEQTIADYCRRCVGNNWDEISEQLSKIGRSEFEDYVPPESG